MGKKTKGKGKGKGCRAIALAIAVMATGCASTGAYLQKNPSHEEEVAIATAAAGCVDVAAAGVILEASWQQILVTALACVDGLVREHFLANELQAVTREAVHTKIEAQQNAAIRALRQGPKAAPQEPQPQSKLLPPLPIDHTVSWETRIAEVKPQ